MAPPQRVSARDYAVFLADVLNTTPARREALWRANRASADDDGELRAALLQSVPEHSGYDLAAARRRLTALIERQPGPDIADFARLRLAELRADEAARAEITVLRSRVAQLIEIENQLPRPGATP